MQKIDYLQITINVLSIELVAKDVAISRIKSKYTGSKN